MKMNTRKEMKRCGALMPKMMAILTFLLCIEISIGMDENDKSGADKRPASNGANPPPAAEAPRQNRPSMTQIGDTFTPPSEDGESGEPAQPPPADEEKSSSEQPASPVEPLSPPPAQRQQDVLKEGLTASDEYDMAILKSYAAGSAANSSGSDAPTKIEKFGEKLRAMQNVHVDNTPNRTQKVLNKQINQQDLLKPAQVSTVPGLLDGDLEIEDWLGAGTGEINSKGNFTVNIPQLEPEEPTAEKKVDWKGLAGLLGATSGLCGVSLLTYSMSTWINSGCKVADPTAFWIPLGIGAGLLLIGLATCFWKKDLINKQRMGIAAVLVFQASAISMIAFGGFEQAGKNVIHIDELGGMNVFLLIGASVFVVSLIFMGIFYKCGKSKSMNSQLAMGLGAVLTVLVGGSATTIALSPTLLTGSATWIGIGVGAFVLLAMLVQASISCVKFGGDNVSKKTGAAVFAAWTGIIALAGTSAAMISTSAINGQVVLNNPLFWIGAVLAGVVAVGLLAGRLLQCCQKRSACRNLFFQ